MMTNSIELTHAELVKLDQILEAYVQQQNDQREKLGESDEDKLNDSTLLFLRGKIHRALQPPKEKEYNVYFI